MKKRLIAVLLLSALLLSLVACTTTVELKLNNSSTGTLTLPTSEVTQSLVPPVQLDHEKFYQFLFIGNQYTTAIHKPTDYFGNFLESSGYQATVTYVDIESTYLFDAASPYETHGKYIEKLLADYDYDYVIIQDKVQAPEYSPDKFYEGVRKLVKKVRADGTEPLLYSISRDSQSSESTVWKVSSAYAAIGDELDVPVAHVGLAFEDVALNYPSIDLYGVNGPSAYGSYLAAMTLFAKITGVDPHAVKYNGGLSGHVTNILKDAARKVVFGTPEIPDEYKTSSVGIAYDLGHSIDVSGKKELEKVPDAPPVSILTGGIYPNGKSFSGILGTKGAVASTQVSPSALSDAAKADIADIGYGVSVIGIEKMFIQSSGYHTALENLIDGHWGFPEVSNFKFDSNTYNVQGEIDPNGDFTGLITLNFGSIHRFDAIGFVDGVPGAAAVYVSNDGINWTVVPTACWDEANGARVATCGVAPTDLCNHNAQVNAYLFDMEDVLGQYIRIGIINEQSELVSNYSDFCTREILVYGEKVVRYTVVFTE